MKNRSTEQNISNANDIAVSALSFLAEDAERFGRFLALSGLDPASIRQAATSPGFLAGILDHVAGDESLLLAFAAESGISPANIAAAHALLTSDRTP